jgi:uncharacterized protein (DUF3084 family)
MSKKVKARSENIETMGERVKRLESQLAYTARELARAAKDVNDKKVEILALSVHYKVRLHQLGRDEEAEEVEA